MLHSLDRTAVLCNSDRGRTYTSVIFVNENKNENGEKRENNELVNDN